MSLPVVLPSSCCPVTGASLASQLADPSYRSRARCLSTSSRSQPRLIPALLPGRPLLSLGLLQLVLGCSMVALSFGALSLSSSPPIRNSCPFWAGSSVILSGVVGLTTWRRPMLLLVNLFVLLSVVCVLLNLAGFILCCQGAQLISSMANCHLSELGDVCYCCPVTPSSKCPEDKLLLLYPGHSCSTVRLLLKKVMFALCALNALTTAVCLVAAALRYLQIFTSGPPCVEEPRALSEEGEEPTPVPDPEEFVAPAPPPSYFSTFYSYTPRLARRMFGESVIPLPHIYGARIKGVEVFCPLDPPPPYEAVAGGSAHHATVTQETAIPLNDLAEALTERTEAGVNTGAVPMPDSSAPAVPPSPPRRLFRPLQSQSTAMAPPPNTPPPPPDRRAQRRLRRSNSNPVLLDLEARVLSSDTPPHTSDSSTQTSHPALSTQQPQTVTLRRGAARRQPRPSSMVDHQSYRHTQQLVRSFLERPAARGLAPEVQALMDSIRNVLQSDQEHMEEAFRCATFIDQVMTISETGQSAANQQPSQPDRRTLPLPSRKRPGLLHLQSCGDLSSFTWAELQPLERRGAGSRAGSRGDHHERPHSLIGVCRETVL